MRLVVISDTHNYHRDMEIPDGDVLIHCGDFSMSGGLRDVVELNKWFGELPHKRKIVTPGNHDFICEDNMALAKATFTNAWMLVNDELVLNGITFWVSPYTPLFGNWAFMRSRGDEMAKIWKNIPSYTDVLVTHGPPHGILDVNDRHEHCGCYDLWLAVQRIKPRCHFFGHIHEGYGEDEIEFEPGNRTCFYNCAVVNEKYELVNEPTVVDL